MTLSPLPDSGGRQMDPAEKLCREHSLEENEYEELIREHSRYSRQLAKEAVRLKRESYGDTGFNRGR